jgi:hypothetical protein
LRQLSPIEPKPKLNVLLVYNDEYRDDIERLPQIPIDFILDVDLTTTVLITAVTLLVGSLVGAWLRIKLVQAPADEQVLAAWERVLASVLLAGVIAVMVVTARVEILAQAASLQIPLHKPAGIFLIAFIVAVIDPSDWLRKVRDKFGPRSSGSSPAPAAPAVTKDVKP